MDAKEQASVGDSPPIAPLWGVLEMQMQEADADARSKTHSEEGVWGNPSYFPPNFKEEVEAQIEVAESGVNRKHLEDGEGAT